MRIAIILGLLLVLLLVIPAASGSEFYLVPDSASGGEFCNSTTVEIWINATVDVRSGKVTIETDQSCGSIVACRCEPATWSITMGEVIDPSRMRLMYALFMGPDKPAGHYKVGELDIHCNSTTYCITDVAFNQTDGTDNETYAANETHLIPVTWDDGTFTCGTSPSAENFSKPLYEGWNLISLPLDPMDNSAVSAVLSTVSYDAVHRYNATSKEFVELIDSTNAMDPGTGYFVHATSDCIWNYSGYAYDPMNIQLKDGLNMVGWLNCTKGVDDALSSISGDYYYVARWNTQAQRFEVYNPEAPDAFDDYTAMDRGTGYFISSRDNCTLSESIS